MLKKGISKPALEDPKGKVPKGKGNKSCKAHEGLWPEGKRRNLGGTNEHPRGRPFC